MSNPKHRFQVSEAHKSLISPELRAALQEQVNIVNAWRERIRAQRGWDPLHPPEHMFPEFSAHVEALAALWGNFGGEAHRSQVLKELDCRTYEESQLLEKYESVIQALGADGIELFRFTLSLIELLRLGDEARRAFPQGTSEPIIHPCQEKNMTSADALSELIDETWDYGSPLCLELERRFTDQFVERLQGEAAMPRLRTLHRTLAGHEPLTLMLEHLICLPDPPFCSSDPEFQARNLPPEVRATAVEFFRTTIDLVTRYAGEFIARNADLAAPAPEHNREYYLLNRTMDRILDHLQSTLDPERQAVTESGIE
jgi:hypothetical protein